MVEFKIATSEDILSVYELCKEYSLPIIDNADYTVVKEGNNILGVTSQSRWSATSAELGFIFIIPTERGTNLGDGLLRATIYHLQEKGYKNIFIKNNPKYNEFLIKEGLKTLDIEDTPIDEELKIEVLDKSYFYCQPERFFSKKCRGSRM